MPSLWRTFFEIYNAWRIPKLPRVYASKYDTIPAEAVDVMRRLGCRDPRGVQIAMKRHGVTSIKELVAILEYQQAKRNTRHRVWLAIGRVVGGRDVDPHRADIMKETRPGKKSAASQDIRQRMKDAARMMKDA